MSSLRSPRNLKDEKILIILTGGNIKKYPKHETHVNESIILALVFIYDCKAKVTVFSQWINLNIKAFLMLLLAIYN
jgi:hypothetical protein